MKFYFRHRSDSWKLGFVILCFYRFSCFKNWKTGCLVDSAKVFEVSARIRSAYNELLLETYEKLELRSEKLFSNWIIVEWRLRGWEMLSWMESQRQTSEVSLGEMAFTDEINSMQGIYLILMQKIAEKRHNLPLQFTL